MVNQDAAELAEFCDLVRGLNARRYLEIGSRNGDSFYAVMTAIGGGGIGLAIDLSENSSARENLTATVNRLRADGVEAFAAFGNSGSPEIIATARGMAPFDLILIDADHRYEGVRHDFETYGGMAPVVAFHDVAAPDGHMSDHQPNGVGRFWREIKDRYQHREIVTQGSNMGLGILFRDAA
jgi:predicted O-methyltransferase YrrM